MAGLKRTGFASDITRRTAALENVFSYTSAVNNLETGAASRISRSLPQSGSDKVEQFFPKPELNPYVMVNPFSILVNEGFNSVQEELESDNKPCVSRSSLSNSVEPTPAGMGKTDQGRYVYTSSRDVTVSGSTQDAASWQAEQADRFHEKAEINRYLRDSNFNCIAEDVNKTCGDTSNRTKKNSQGLIDEKIEAKVSVVDPICSFTSREGVIVDVYDECKQGIYSCDYSLCGERLQLKPCRFAYLVCLGTAECKKAYEPLVSDITDGFKVVDENMDLSNMHYECDNYNSVYTPENKAKMDNIIGKELSEGYLKIVNNKPTCIHSMGAVPKPDGGIRPITDCSMPRDISVNNYCANIIQEFQYQNVDHVLAMLQEGDYMAVVDIKSAHRAVPIFPDHRRWEINGETVFIEDSRLCFGLFLGPSYLDKI